MQSLVSKIYGGDSQNFEHYTITLHKYLHMFYTGAREAYYLRKTFTRNIWISDVTDFFLMVHPFTFIVCYAA